MTPTRSSQKTARRIYQVQQRMHVPPPLFSRNCEYLESNVINGCLQRKQEPRNQFLPLWSLISEGAEVQRCRELCFFVTSLSWTSCAVVALCWQTQVKRRMCFEKFPQNSEWFPLEPECFTAVGFSWKPGNGTLLLNIASEKGHVV